MFNYIVLFFCFYTCWFEVVNVLKKWRLKKKNSRKVLCRFMDPSSDSKMLSDRMQRLRGKKRANESEEIGSYHHQEEKTGSLNRFVMRLTKVDRATQNSSVDVPSTIGNLSDGSGGSPFTASVVKFQGVKGLEDFKISVDGLILDSELPTGVRVKYYELCNSQKMFLHDHLITGLGSKLVSGVISETTNIADAIKSASVTHSFHNLECWKKTLKAFEDLGMNVGFLRTRVDKLVNISRQYQATNQAKEAKFAQLEARKKALGERVSTMEALQKSIATLQELIKILQKPIKILEAEIDGIEGKNEELGLEFKEIATAAW